ncbi:MAG: hypothetical protein IJN60_04065 [Oscillospiraceae bacterium]|nr:hypothetical protein [Oscillospiraceae bacterium]
MRILKRAISLFLVLIFVLSFPLYNSAAALAFTDPTQITDIINRYSFDEDNEYTIVDSIPMRSFVDDSEQYTLYLLAPYGYAILYNETNGFMEGCYSENTFVEQMEDQTTYYYGGPGNYYTYNGEHYCSLISGDVLESTAIQSLANAEEIVRANEDATQDTTAISPRGLIYNDREVVVAESYFSNLVKYGENVDGTCTVLAIAILLGYYDEFVDDDYVLDRYRDGNGTNEDFHQTLINFVYEDDAPGGLYIRDALDGINWYLDFYDISSRLYALYGSPGRVANKIVSMLESGYPVVASMGTGYGGPYNHTAVVYGAIYNTTTSVLASGVYQVHMGWGEEYGASGRSFSARATWFYECGYIQ